MMHRDLKAANVLAFLSEDDDNHLHIVKLADVGLARVLEVRVRSFVLLLLLCVRVSRCV